MAGVEYQVTKVDPTDPETKGMVYQVHKVTEEIAATLGGKVYRARIIKDPTDPTVAGKVYQIVLIGDPDDPAVKGKVYNAILTGGSEAVIVGPGVSPLDLDNAVAEAIYSLIAYGGTEVRSGLPDGYTQLDYIESTGTQRIDTGVSGNATIKITAQASAIKGSSQALLSSTSGATGGSWFGEFTTNQKWGIGTGAGLTTIDPTTKITAEIVFDENGCSGTVNSESITRSAVGTQSDWAIMATTQGSYPFSGKVWGCQITQNDVLVRNFVPCKNTSNVVGMYDTVSGTFFTNDGTGDFVAGPAVVPTPTAPMNIVCNNGVLKFSPNEANYIADNVTLGYWLRNSDGQPEQSSANFYTDMMPVKPNTSYVAFGRKKDTNVISGYNRIAWYDAGGVWIRNSTYTANTPGIDTSPANAAFARFHCNPSGATVTQDLVDSYNWVFQQGTAEVPYIPYSAINPYVEGTQETIAITADGVAVSSATCENLFAVGGYKDQQDVVSGEVTRKVGVKMLDGTEDWAANTVSSGRLVFYVTKVSIGSDSTVLPNGSPNIKCSHFETSTAAAQSLYGTVWAGGTAINFTAGDFCANLTAWKQWLADQYNAGTPVIIVYPLATPTTETVTGQPMETTDGDNVAEITQASIDGLELEVEYEKEAE